MPRAETTRPMRLDARLLRALAKGGVVVYLAVLVAAFGLANNQFFALSTLLAIISVSSPLMVAAAAMTMCLICAEVDLSVVGVAGLASALTALMLSKGVPWPPVVLAAIGVGAVAGAINGVLTGHLAPVMPFFPSFFPTLATTALTLGLAEALLTSKQAIAITIRPSPARSALPRLWPCRSFMRWRRSSWFISY
jgi:ribose/xylose/arabinose/galactoside ABC-type transport system permease subunit